MLTKVSSLGERLRSERQRAFVGRAPELALFRHLLGHATHSLLFVQGQAGVGKSALLQEYQRVALSAGHQAFLIDAPQLRDRAEPGRLALRQQLLSSFQARARPGGTGRRDVLLLDGFDAADEHAWLLTELIPALSSDVLLVFGSRTQAPPSLSLDPGWSHLILMHELPPLAQSEAATMLELRHVPHVAQREILEFAGGFPLALAVAAKVLSSAESPQFTLDRLQEVQHRLGQLLCPAPASGAQQLALDICSLSRTTTADLLDVVRRTTPPEPDAETTDSFNWLSQQSFIEWTPTGLRPHLLVRIALEARLRRERPRRYRTLLQALREAAIADLTANGPAGSGLANLFFLDRDAPRARRWVTSLQLPSKSLEPAHPHDHDAIVELVRKTEGDEAAALIVSKKLSSVDHFEVLRGDGIEGCLFFTRLDAEVGPRRLSSKDPASALLRGYMESHPLQTGEESLFFRWWHDPGRDASSPAGVLAISGRQAQIVLATPRIPYSACVVPSSTDWTSLWNDISLPWHVVGRFRLGAHEHSLVVFDWRRRSLREVLANPWRLAERQAIPEIPASSFDELRVKVSERVAGLARKVELTPREQEILEQLCLGHSVDTIARNLSIRPRTVKFHQENLLRKTGASSRVELFRRLL